MSATPQHPTSLDKESHLESNAVQAVQADVVVVGAGLVGSAIAAALAKASGIPLNIIVIDKHEPKSAYSTGAFDPRVVALSRKAIDFLDGLGAWSKVEALRYCPYRGMEVWDGEGNGRIDFSSEALHRDYLGCIVENSLVQQALHEVLTDRVTVMTGVSVNGWERSEVSNRLHLENGVVVEAPLLIAADGGHSQLRTWAQIPTMEWDYHHRAIVTTIRTQKPHGFVARQRFSHQGPLALLPLYDSSVDASSDGRDHYCSIVWSLEDAAAAEVMSLTDEAFCERLTRVSESCLGQVEHVDTRFLIPLWQRHAHQYGEAGFALVGDAAHTIHPLAGQGVNLGLYDAEVLAAEIVRAKTRQVPLSHPSIVQRYQRQRKAHNLTAMAMMEGFKRLFGNSSPLALTVRNKGMSWVNDQLWLKRQLMMAAAGEL